MVDILADSPVEVQGTSHMTLLPSGTRTELLAMICIDEQIFEISRCLGWSYEECINMPEAERNNFYEKVIEWRKKEAEREKKMWSAFRTKSPRRGSGRKR